MPTQTFTTGPDKFTVPAGPGTYDLDFLAGNDWLYVNGGDSTTAHMDEGNDTVTLNAGTGTIFGGLGDDVYYVNVAGYTLTENPGEGVDTVRSTLSYTLGDNFERLVLAGTAAIDGNGNDLNNVLRGNNAANTIEGFGGNDLIVGYDGNDTLIGDAGNDHLDGRTGADTMIGGVGNDVYYVDNIGDVVTENAGEGVDLVQSWISYTLGANLERLNLAGSAAIDATGNDLNNVIRGNNAANVIDGGNGNDLLSGLGGDDTLIGGAGNDKMWGNAGSDTMSGGIGNDTYYVSDATDVVIENPGEGTDFIYTTVSYTLPANVERLFLSGSAAINGTGNDLNNVIGGNSGANVLDGAGGNDTITGGGGTDTLTGGAGNDTFVYNSINDSPVGSGDTITDFTSAPGEGSDDQIDLSGIDANTSTSGDQAFAISLTGAAANSIWVSNDVTGHEWVLQGDVNGDGVADFEIHFHTSGVTFQWDDITR